MSHPSLPPRTALVLGGGGLKGFAHIGVLRALAERGIVPSQVAGTSIGSLIAAAHAGGMSTDEMAQRARDLKRRDLFRLNHMGMIMERIRSRSIYLAEPLRELCAAVAPAGTFADMKVPLLVNTVDLERGSQVVWGLPGLRDVPVMDAVYASCALPGFFPPGELGGRVCIDGGTSDNLPAAAAALNADAVIAVDVGSSDRGDGQDIVGQGFASIYMRAASLMMRELQQGKLARWSGPPMLLIRPPVWHHHWFAFGNADELVEAGYCATMEALDQIGDSLLKGGGIYPRRLVQVSVNEEE